MQYQINQPLVLAPKRHPRRWLLLIAVLTLATILLVRFLAAPNEGKTTTVDVRAKKQAASMVTTAAPGAVDNQYFKLPLATGYKLISTQTGTGDALRIDTISHASLSGTQLITISIIPSTGLDSLSSYRSRQQSGAYSFTSKSVSGTTATIATKTDGAEGEVTAFWSHGNYLATIGISTNLGTSADTATNQATLHEMLTTWQWK